MNEEYLTTKEVAELLQVHPQTVHRYAKEGKLTAAPDHPTFPIRRHKLFKQDSVLALLKQQEKKGLTVSEVAKKLKTTKVTITRYILEGKLKAEKEAYRAAGRYIIQPEDLQVFMDKEMYVNPNTNTEKYYSLKNSIYLYQPFTQTGSQQLARVISVKKNSIELVTSEGKQLSFEQAKELHFKPLQTLVSRPYIQKKGSLTFKFPFPTDIQDRTYDVIDWFMRELGYNNMQIDKKQNYIIITIKSAIIETNNHVDFIEILKKYCISGSVSRVSGAIALESEYYYVSTYIHKDTKKWIDQQAKEQNVSQKNFIANILEKNKTNEGSE